MESCARAMSEFKFACPACGQHLTADPSNSGSQIVCPTCFQSLVVPQAPAAADSKLILAAAQVKPARLANAGNELGPLHRSRTNSVVGALLLLVLLASAGVGLYVAWPHIPRLLHRRLPDPVSFAKATNVAPPTLPPSPYAVPTNIVWTTDIANVAIPDAPIAGRIHGSGFRCERATLTGGALTLRQGDGWPPHLAVSILLPAQRGEFLSGKNIIIPAGATSALPRLILRWRDAASQEHKEEFGRDYVLKLGFGNAVTGTISGRIYLAAPDETKSFVAGAFTAEIRQPAKR